MTHIPRPGELLATGVAALTLSAGVGALYAHEEQAAEAAAAAEAHSFIDRRESLERAYQIAHDEATQALVHIESQLGDSCMQLVFGWRSAAEIVENPSRVDTCELRDGEIAVVRVAYSQYQHQQSNIEALQRLVAADSDNVANAQALIDEATDGDSLIDEYLDSAPRPAQFTQVDVNAIAPSDGEIKGVEIDVVKGSLLPLSVMLGIIGSLAILGDASLPLMRRLKKAHNVRMMHADIETFLREVSEDNTDSTQE